MTTTNHRLIDHASVADGRRWRLRWGGTVSAWRDPFGVGGRSRRSHVEVALVVTFEMHAPGEAIVEAWIDHPGARRAVLDRDTVPVAVTSEDGLLHVDAERDGVRLLAVTVETASGRLLYATTSLLSGGEFAVGAFDPPVAERTQPARSVASA